MVIDKYPIDRIVLVDLLWQDQTLFKNMDVFDLDYVPEEFLHREKQLTHLAVNLKPALRKSRPINTLCLGPPSTGKTTAVKIIFKEIENASDVVIPVYVNCQIINSKQQVFAKIFEKVYGYSLPSYGVPFSKVYYSILKKILDEEKVLIVALDDLNLIFDDTTVNEILHALIKAHEEVDGVKIGVIGISTDIKILERFDASVGSIFHPDEIYFPPYSREEIYDILASRAKYGFYPNVLSDEALEKIVDLTYDVGDLRFGIYLLKMSGLEAERRASKRIEVRDVEAVCKDGRKVFLRKGLLALNSAEIALLKLIYSTSEELTTGELFKRFKRIVSISYTKFYEMLLKLENLRLIDTKFDRERRGKTRLILRRYDSKTVLDALNDFIRS